MTPQPNRPCTAFANHKIIATGDIQEVALKVKSFLNDHKAQILIFDDVTSAQIELDLRGTAEAVARRLEKMLEPQEKKAGPGRPKLGVVSKEVTLLPHHWEWLALQPGGASVTLRKLIEEAKKKNASKDLIRQAQESTYKFMQAMAGDLPDYEEALRALYAGDEKSFEKRIADWPADIKKHTSKLAKNAF